MDFSEVIGFFVTLAAIAYMFIKRARDARDRPDHSDDENEQENKLEDFLKSLEEDMEESKDFKPLPKPKTVAAPPKAYAVKKSKPPKQIPQGKEGGGFRSNLDGYTSHSSIEERKLKTNITSKYEGDYGEHLLSAGFRSDTKDKVQFVSLRGPSRIKRLVRNLPSKKDMILINEIFNKPKGLS